MKYTLKDYQEDAVREVLSNLRRAAQDWRQHGDLSAFSLTATTGAGKTVMAAAVIEALFAGNVENDFPADPGAVVLWFTDDPALNEQTRERLAAASDRLDQSGRMVVIENTFNQEKLEAGWVYFLNSQKLAKNALLVRSTDEEGMWKQLSFAGIPSPDKRAHTMWDILRATIEDTSLTLYLVLDEAHRGMKANSDRTTIVQGLINGTSGAPPIPVVFGISATVERFNEAMKAQQGRTIRPPVLVDPARVQESGLLKDDIRLEFPIDSGSFDLALLARATRKLRDTTKLWHDYAEREARSEDAVIPLMVVQVPNKTTESTLQQAVMTIRDAWPEIEVDAFANVFGEHKDLDLNGIVVAYVPPQLVQGRTHIRVLFAKDAISTGWDCPRAEVFVSFRPAKDLTYITQLLGRMVRAPLARRIPGNDLLNSVTCLLPEFNRAAAQQVAKAITGDRSADDDGTGGGEGRRVLLAPQDMSASTAIVEAVWAAFDALPSETLPRKQVRPIVRFMALAHALSMDGVRTDAIKEAYLELSKTLEAFCARFPELLEAAMDEVITMDGEALSINVHSGVITSIESFREAADTRAIEAQYNLARRRLTPELAKRHAERVAEAEYDGSLLDGHIKVAAIARMEGVKDALDKEAEQLAAAWFDAHRVQVKGLPDARRVDYDRIKGMSPRPERISIQRPYIRTEETQDEHGNLLPTRAGHLMSDEDGQFPVATLNDWELQVLDTEMARNDFLAWYRNPARASSDSLVIPWQDAAGNWRRMCPDFVFFHGSSDKVRASIVDPHGTHLADALPKLLGLARYAETHGNQLHRIEAVAEIGADLRVLDLQRAEVRQAIRDATNIEALYVSQISAIYC